MSSDPQLKNILQRLLKRTESRKQEWKPSNRAIGPTFETLVGDWKIVVYSEDGDGKPPLRMELRNKVGTELETLQTTEVMRIPREERDEVRALNRDLTRLYQLAKRQALGVDEALSEIEKLLE